MRKTFNHTGRIFLLKLIFPLIYAGFFVVQLFINFDTALTRNSDRYQFIQLKNTTRAVVASQGAKTNQPIKTKFRLNKRFQPAFISILPDISYSPVITFITIRRVGYSSPFISHPLRDNPSRRGPPVMA